jgi:hypothetical protein
MRIIRFKRPGPTGRAFPGEEDLLTFLLHEARLTYHPFAYGELPPLEVLNDIFKSGRGDDGAVCMTWDPFSISTEEYGELTGQFEVRGVCGADRI